MFVVSRYDLPEFMVFLHIKCKLNLLPPCEPSDVFRAQAGEHHIRAVETKDDEIHVSSDAYFEPQLANVGRSRAGATLPCNPAASEICTGATPHKKSDISSVK